MSERNINIDDLFKDALKDFEVPSPLRSKTAKKDSFAKKNAKWLIGGSAALIAVAASYMFVFSHSEKTNDVSPVQQKAAVVPMLVVPAEKEIVRDTIVKVIEVPKNIVVEAAKAKAEKEVSKVIVPVYQENNSEKSMIITTRSSYSETFEVDEKGNKIKVLSTQKTQRSDTTLVK